MAIRPPSWCRHAVPTPTGWKDPKTNELLKAVNIKGHMIDEWNAANNTPIVEEIVEPVAVEEPNPSDDIAEDLPEIIVDMTVFPEDELEEEMMQDDDMQMLNEAPANNKPLDEMSKLELEELGRQHGVELDRRKSKKTLVEKMKSLVG